MKLGPMLVALSLSYAVNAYSAPLPPAKDAMPTATLRLAARCERGDREPSALDVTLSLPLDGVPVFQLGDQVFGSAGMARLISAAEATDQSGRLALVRQPGEALQLRGIRAVQGTLTFRYRARSVPVAESGARYGLRHDATGIGGLGAFFLVLPDSTRAYALRIEWGRLACAAREGQAMSSFGFGVVEHAGPGLLETLRTAVYFIGNPRLTTVDDGAMHIRSLWFGQPGFDPGSASTWTAQAFAAQRRFFFDEDAAPYHVFIRVLPAMGERSNGMGQSNSFLSAIGPRTGWGPRLRSNIAHEMLHRWLGIGLRLAGPDGSNLWFTEGFTVYYAPLLMLRAGLISPEEFLEELKGTTTRHYANPRGSATNDEIRRGFFEDERLSVVPYTRGALYAAELDAAIRAASGGARSLDDLVIELYRQTLAAPADALAARELPVAEFRQAVFRELGGAGVDRFDSVIIQGTSSPEPPSDAYGPCFERVKRSFPQFELGFREAADQRLRELIPGSAAAKGGLLEGDALISVDSSLLRPDKEVVVTVDRGGLQHVVRYFPARQSRTREGFEWRALKSIGQSRCTLPVH